MTFRLVNSLVIFCLSMFGAWPIHALAKTYYVSPTGSDNNDGSINSPFRSIQRAADLVNPGDVVIVKDGRYTNPGNLYGIVSLNRGGTSDNWVTFRSESKWGAIVDGENYKTRFGWVLGDNASYVRIENFQITETWDDAIISNQSAHDVYIFGNEIHHISRICTDDGGGHSGVYQGSRTRDHSYDSNVFHHIGRLHEGENGCTNGNLFWQNHDHGVYINNNTGTVLVNNIFYEIKSGWSITIDRSASDVVITNNTIVGSNPNRDGQILLYGKNGSRPNNMNILIQNNIIYRPRGAAIRLYPTVGKQDIIIRNNLVVGVNNITSQADQANLTSEYVLENNIIVQDPGFVDVNKDDFRLDSRSPAINSGISENAPLYDIEGSSRPFPANGQFDIGAYEFGGVASNRSPRAKITADLLIGAVPLSVDFSGSQSSDIDGTIAEYQWDFGDGQTSKLADPPSHNYDQVGNYQAKLIVVDDEGAKGEDQVTVSVLPEGAAKDLYLEAESGVITTPLTVVSDANASGGASVTTPSGTSNAATPTSEAEYRIALQNSGRYFLWVRMFAPSTSKDAIFVGFNNNLKRLFAPVTQAYVWAKSEDTFALNAGPNLLNLGHAEPETRVDRIFITLDPDAQPSDDATQANVIAHITLSDPSPTKAGPVQVTLTTSTAIIRNPGPLMFTAVDGSKTAITLNGSVPGDTFTGVVVIDGSIADGQGFFSLSTNALEDADGNTGNEIVAGAQVLIDQTPPSQPQNGKVRVNN